MNLGCVVVVVQRMIALKGHITTNINLDSQTLDSGTVVQTCAFPREKNVSRHFWREALPGAPCLARLVDCGIYAHFDHQRTCIWKNGVDQELCDGCFASARRGRPLSLCSCPCPGLDSSNFWVLDLLEIFIYRRAVGWAQNYVVLLIDSVFFIIPCIAEGL